MNSIKMNARYIQIRKTKCTYKDAAAVFSFLILLSLLTA